MTALATYLVKTHLYSLLLENDKSASFLDFESNTNLTLRTLLRDENLFVRLVEKFVDINSQHAKIIGEDMMNVLLLDKVGKHEQVLK